MGLDHKANLLSQWTIAIQINIVRAIFPLVQGQLQVCHFIEKNKETISLRMILSKFWALGEPEHILIEFPEQI